MPNGSDPYPYRELSIVEKVQNLQKTEQQQKEKIKEQQQQIEELQKEIEELKTTIRHMKTIFNGHDHKIMHMTEPKEKE